MSKHHLAREFENLTKDIMTDSRLHQMKNYIQHGRVTTFDHAVDVARMSFLIHKGLRLKSDPKELLRGALLHDYFLYDWHKEYIQTPEEKESSSPLDSLHGFSHAGAAARNAKRDFETTEKEGHIIESHMWPLNITKIPRTTNAWIVCIADKICSARETLFKR